MVQEQETKISPNRSALGRVIDISRELGELYAIKRESVLSHDQKGKLDELNGQKNKLLVEILEFRRIGDDSITAIIFGKPEDKLHPYSRNRIEISFPHPNPPYNIYRTASNLSVLASYCGGLDDLIGSPDGFKQEQIADYVIRTIAEISDLGHDLDRAMNGVDLARQQELSCLKAILAARVIKLRIDRGLTRREIELKLLKDPKGKAPRDIVEVNFYPGKGKQKWGFHMPTIDPFYKSLIKPLIDELGGFDRETIRRGK